VVETLLPTPRKEGLAATESMVATSDLLTAPCVRKGHFLFYDYVLGYA
jgi:hypothetical protein